MGLNNANSSDYFDNLKITEYEIEVIKDYFKRYIEENEKLFKNTIEQHLSELKKYREDQAMHMVYRAMIIMKRNGAESIVDFDKLNNNFLKIESSQNIEEQSLKISELNKEEEKQKSKEQVQAEIMSHFIQSPDENILMSMVISKDLEDGCEIVEFIDGEYEDEKMNDLFNGPFGIKVGGITIKADETGEKGEEFSKELVIDRKTNTKGILFIGKKGLKLEKFDFEDISKFEASFETYFVYKKEGKTLVKIIKNEIAKVNFRTTDGQSSDDIIFKQELLDKLTPEMIQQSQEGIMKLLKDAKQNGTLDMVVEMLSNQMPIREEMKKDLEEELYALANSQ